MNVQAPQRLHRPVFTGHPCQPLDQLFPMGVCLALLPLLLFAVRFYHAGPSTQLDPARASRRVSDNHPGELSHESSLCEEHTSSNEASANLRREMRLEISSTHKGQTRRDGPAHSH